MVDVLKTLNLDYIAVNPGSAFDGLHESLINYGQNKKPEMLSCMHEEIAVAMAHGYAKIEGRPLPVLVQSTVGLQHASMALYNAFCDQVPIYMIAGNTVDVTSRGLSFESPHSAIDPAVTAQTTTTPGGGSAIIVPNGNGTSTIIHSDGRIETVPTPR